MNRRRADLHALAAAYALDALEAGEHELFTAHLDRCEECSREVAEFRATTALLAAAVSRPPPAGMKRRTLAAVDGVRQLPPRSPVTRFPALTHGALRRRTGVLVAAASLAAAALFAGLAARQYEEGRRYEQQARQIEQRLDTVGAVLAAPDARATYGRTSNGASTAIVTSALRNQALFYASGLPTPVPGTTYQLWLDQGGTMRPAGLLHRDGTVLLDGDTADAGAVGLTLEPTGGSSRPTTAPLLLLHLPA